MNKAQSAVLLVSSCLEGGGSFLFATQYKREQLVTWAINKNGRKFKIQIKLFSKQAERIFFSTLVTE
jgi:hypothetical protein